MKTLSHAISVTQTLAYESASHELGRLLDDAAALLWKVHGEESVIGRLADEARWAAFLLHDRIATHALQEGGVSEHDLAIRALTPGEVVFCRHNRFRADPGRPRGLGPEPYRELAAALSTTKASMVGMSGGYARVCSHGHPVMEALRDAEDALDALRAELDREQRAAHGGGVREGGPFAALVRPSRGGRSMPHALLFLRQRAPAASRSRPQLSQVARRSGKNAHE